MATRFCLLIVLAKSMINRKIFKTDRHRDWGGITEALLIYLHWLKLLIE